MNGKPELPEFPELFQIYVNGILKLALSMPWWGWAIALLILLGFMIPVFRNIPKKKTVVGVVVGVPLAILSIILLFLLWLFFILPVVVAFVLLIINGYQLLYPPSSPTDLIGIPEVSLVQLPIVSVLSFIGFIKFILSYFLHGDWLGGLLFIGLILFFTLPIFRRAYNVFKWKGIAGVMLMFFCIWVLLTPYIVLLGTPSIDVEITNVSIPEIGYDRLGIASDAKFLVEGKIYSEDNYFPMKVNWCMGYFYYGEDRRRPVGYLTLNNIVLEPKNEHKFATSVTIKREQVLIETWTSIIKGKRTYLDLYFIGKARVTQKVFWVAETTEVPLLSYSELRLK